MDTGDKVGLGVIVGLVIGGLVGSIGGYSSGRDHGREEKQEEMRASAIAHGFARYVAVGSHPADKYAGYVAFRWADETDSGDRLPTPPAEAKEKP